MSNSLDSFATINTLVDAREDDSVSSWIAAKPYRVVMEMARKQCPTAQHLMTLVEYMGLWMQTAKHGNRACNEADIWTQFASDRDENNPLSYLRHPFKSTVLVDTYLTDFSMTKQREYEALVVIGNKPQERVVLPVTGKIYALNKYGLPSATGGRKTDDSNDFEHRWWAFSSDQLKDKNGKIKKNFTMALFANGGTIGCFCELIKAHYSLDEAGGFYRILSFPDG